MNILATIILATSLTLGSTSGVTQEQFEAAHAGQSRAHVENVVFDGHHGRRTGMYATDTRRVLTKVYKREGGGLDRLTFWGPLCKCGPFEGPYQLHKKEQLP